MVAVPRNYVGNVECQVVGVYHLYLRILSQGNKSWTETKYCETCFVLLSQKLTSLVKVSGIVGVTFLPFNNARVTWDGYQEWTPDGGLIQLGRDPCWNPGRYELCRAVVPGAPLSSPAIIRKDVCFPLRRLCTKRGGLWTFVDISRVNLFFFSPS